jgi:ABC-type Fe3+/spermidine/putrescine transport system ATPase subunit
VIARAPEPLRLVGVSKSLGGRRVLDAIDLDVPAGSLLVLLGHSGSGKTTLLRTVAGLSDPDAGTISVGGTVVADPRPLVPPERRGVGMVFQSLELWPHMTAAENVAFGLPGRPRGRGAEGHARVRELADAVGIGECLSRRPSALSGGERQRVAIARALAPSPALLLYDEPLANLDPDRRGEIRALLRRLRASAPTTIVYVTHDAEEALEMGDEVAVLDGGRIVDRGPPDRVYRSPASVAAARALGAVTVLAARPREGGRAYESALGVLATAGGAPADARLVCLRPEQVVPGQSGVEATVVDAYPRGPDWAFTARLRPTGDAVAGRSPTRVRPGDAVRLSVLGSAAVVSGSGEAKP